MIDTHPHRLEVIREIHEHYLAAGADFIKTSTFGVTRIAQEAYSLETDYTRRNLSILPLKHQNFDHINIS